MTATRPSILTLSGFFLIAALIFAASASPFLQVAARIVA